MLWRGGATTTLYFFINTILWKQTYSCRHLCAMQLYLNQVDRGKFKFYHMADTQKYV